MHALPSPSPAPPCRGLECCMLCPRQLRGVSAVRRHGATTAWMSMHGCWVQGTTLGLGRLMVPYENTRGMHPCNMWHWFPDSAPPPRTVKGHGGRHPNRWWISGHHTTPNTPMRNVRNTPRLYACQHTRVHMYAHAHMSIHMCICMYVCMHACAYVCTYVAAIPGCWCPHMVDTFYPVQPVRPRWDCECMLCAKRVHAKLQSLRHCAPAHSLQAGNCGRDAPHPSHTYIRMYTSSKPICT